MSWNILPLSLPERLKEDGLDLGMTRLEPLTLEICWSTDSDCSVVVSRAWALLKTSPKTSLPWFIRYAPAASASARLAVLITLKKLGLTFNWQVKFSKGKMPVKKTGNQRQCQLTSQEIKIVPIGSSIIFEFITKHVWRSEIKFPW